MLPKTKRLTAKEVREVLKEGRSMRQGNVAARYTTYAGAGKAAVVVSSKVAKKAHDRNRLRRAGYQALATLPHNIKLVLFIQKQDVSPQDIAELCSKLS